MSAGAARPALYVHVGFMKTGTSYLQSKLRRSSGEVRRQGLELVPDTLRATFQLALAVRDRYDPDADPPEVGTALARFPAQLAASTAPRALLTEESLAPATPEQIDRLLDACGSHDVHVVLTVRDLARQIPSSWQQRLQTGSPETFADYLDRLRAAADEDDPVVWRQRDVVATLDRWGARVPAERIHVVTVPPSGSPREELLHRFCRVLDVDPTRLREARTRPNEGLGVVGAELLRRLNEGIDPDLTRRQDYGAVGKRYFALAVLGSGDTGARLRMPRDTEAWCRSVAEEQVRYLRAGGFDVVGDLDDLLPDPAAFTDDPQQPTAEELLALGTRALTTVLTDLLVEHRAEREGDADDRSGQAGEEPAGGGGPSARPRRWLARLARRGG